MVETFFDEETDDAVGVEEEIAPGSILVPDDGIESLELCCLWKSINRRWKREG